MGENRYNVGIVGGGLAGVTAAFEIAKLGLRPLVFEKNPEIGEPVVCGEGVGTEALREVMEIELKRVCPFCIAQEIQEFYLNAPNGTRVRVKGQGYILYKHLFNEFLADSARRAGAKILTRTKAISFERTRGGVEITTDSLGEKQSFFVDVVIAADGPVSVTAKWAGINKKLEPNDTIIAVKSIIKGVDAGNDNFAEFYFGNEIAPKGYAWIFPKGNSIVNAGLGFPIEQVKKTGQGIGYYWNRFAKKKIPNGEILDKRYGIVPVGQYRKIHIADNTIAIGDSGGFANPVTGGGIIYAMKTGIIAGDTAVNAIVNNDTSKQGLIEFEKRTEEIGKKISQHYKIKQALESMTDKDFNTIAAVLQGLELSDISILDLLRKSLAELKRHPALAMKVMRAVTI